MTKTVALIGTLDTKGPEIAYLRDRCRDLGLETIVVDSGILGDPLGIVPNIDRKAVAVAAGSDIDSIRNAGSRGAAVQIMMKGVRRTVLNLYAEGRLHGVACLGGAEGAVLGAHAMQALPIGVPKILATPIASGKRYFDPLIGMRDVMVMHSVVDILGLNPISQTIFDNLAAALAGMVQNYERGVNFDTDDKYVAITMLGNTTRAVMAAHDRLAAAGVKAVVFHANGVGGPAMEELAEQGLFVGTIDFTLNELTGELVGGFHRGNPQRLRVVGRLGLPQVVVPGCIDFTVHGPMDEVPERFWNRPTYKHNPVFTLVRIQKSEMAALGHIVAERLNGAIGPVQVAVPTLGLSIASYPPDGVFWNPEADAAFMSALRANIRADIPVLEYASHVNDPAFGTLVAELLLNLLDLGDTHQ